MSCEVKHLPNVRYYDHQVMKKKVKDGQLELTSLSNEQKMKAKTKLLRV